MPAARPTFTACCLLAAITFAGGCESGPPVGDRGGRLDPYESTRYDTRSDQASIPAMLEFTDRTSERLVRELTSIRALERSDQRLVLELGTIINHTDTPTTDFEQIQRRLRSQLLKSQLVRDHFVIVESRGRMNLERERIGAADTDSKRYSPDRTYVLQGDFFESERSRRRQYYFNFKLTHVGSRAIVFDSDFDLGQVTGG